MNNTHEEMKTIKELYFKNYDIPKIMHITGIKEKEIKDYIFKEKLNKKRSEYFKNIIIDGLKAKKTASEVSKELNCDTKKLCKIAENQNIKIYFKKNNKYQKEKKILEEFNKNPMNIKKMSEKTSYSYNFVQKVYKNHQLLKRVSRNYPFIKLTPEKFQKLILELQNRNKTQTQLAKEYGVSKQRISVINKKLTK